MEIVITQEVNPLTVTNAVVDSMDKAALMTMIQNLQDTFVQISAAIDKSSDPDKASKLNSFVNGNNVNVATTYYAPATKVDSVKAQDFKAPTYAAPELSAVDAASLKNVAKKLRDKDYAYRSWIPASS